MSNSTADNSGDDTKTNAKSNMMKLAGAGMVLLLASLYFFAGGGDTSSTTTQLNLSVAEAQPVVFFDVPEMTVNLATSGVEQQYLRLKISLELPNATMSPYVKEVMPRVLDTFQVYLRELRADDLKGSAGMFRLKDELRKRVNTAIAPAHVNAVLFQEMLVQ